MASAANLQEAAGQSADNLLTKWLAGTLRANILAFCNACLPQFLEQEVKSHPVSNWLTVLIGAATDMLPGNSATVVPYLQQAQAAGYLYRLCWMTDQLDQQNTISSAQALAVLTAYNANF